MSKPTRIYIIEESALVRFGLTHMIDDENDMVVVGSESPSNRLTDDLKSTKAQVVIVDLGNNKNEGIKLLKSFSKLRLPVIVFTETDDSIANDLISLLEVGVVGFVLKPTKDQSVSDIKEQLTSEIRLNTPKEKNKKTTNNAINSVHFLDPLKILMIGSSTGGPDALAEIVTQIPANFKHGLVFVQHMPEGFTNRFSKRLDKLCKIPIKEAEDGEVLKPGIGLLAPGGYHLLFKEIMKDKKLFVKTVLTKDPPVWNLRPTVDKMMTSLASVYKSHAVGVILTGMGEDGVVGMREIKKYGGHTLVQDKKTSVVFGMGQQVIKNNLADEVLPLHSIIPRAVEVLDGKRK